MSSNRFRSDSGGPVTRGRSNSGGINRAFPAKRTDSFLEAEMRASAMTTSVFNASDFKASKEPRRYTENEKELMQEHESVDTFEPQTLLYKDHLSRREKEPRGFIWFYVAMIGFLSGLVGIVIVTLLHFSYALKIKLLAIGLNRFSASEDGDDTSFAQGQDPALVGMAHGHSYFGGYFMWLLFSLTCASLSSAIAYFIPDTVGLGAPEVTAYLNGIENTGMYKPSVLFAKVLCAVLNVASGLPVGHLGAVMQSGSMIASMLVSRSHFARFRKLPIVSCFRNPRDRRIFTVVGAAAGVASAFSVAVGGLTFVMEQLSTVFPVRFAVYVFVSCLVAVFSIQTYFSFVVYFAKRDRGGLEAGQLISDVLIQFDTKIQDVAPVSMNIFDFIPTIFIGFMCGVLCALFIRLTWVTLRIRRLSQQKFRKIRYLEPVIMAFLYTTIMFWITVGFGSEHTSGSLSDSCKQVPQPFLANRNTSIVSYYGLNGVMCDRVQLSQVGNEVKNMQVYQPFGSISMGYADSTLQMLLAWRAPDEFSPQALIVFLIVYYLFAAATSGGMHLSGDFLLPLMVIGATVGRLIGLLVKAIAGELPGTSVWADPGVFALVGAASFLGGATGLTFSICIIMIEITNDFRHGLCVMLAISIAKKVSEKFAHSLGVSYLESKCVPLLDFAQQVEKYDMFCAKHVMATPVTTLHNIATIQSIIELTATTTHSGFPVLSIVDGTYQGLVHKKQLYQVLWHVYLTQSLEAASYEQLNYIEDEGYLERDEDDWIPPFSEEVLEWRLDLNPYIDTAAYCVHESTAMSRTYNMFRTLGLRQLVVITRDNGVAGIITRKDLLADNIMDRILQENRRRARTKNRTASKRASSVLYGGGSGREGNKVTEWLVDQDDDDEEGVASGNINSQVHSFEYGKGMMHPASTKDIHAEATKHGVVAPGEISGSKRRERSDTATSATSGGQNVREPESSSGSGSKRSRKTKKKNGSEERDAVPNLPGKHGDPEARKTIESIMRYTDAQGSTASFTTDDDEDNHGVDTSIMNEDGELIADPAAARAARRAARGDQDEDTSNMSSPRDSSARLGERTRQSNMSFATDAMVEVGSAAAFSPTSPGTVKEYPATQGQDDDSKVDKA